MKTLLLALTLALAAAWPTQAYAACTVHFITTPDGRTMSCLTCCYGNGACNTTCS